MRVVGLLSGGGGGRGADPVGWGAEMSGHIWGCSACCQWQGGMPPLP